MGQIYCQRTKQYKKISTEQGFKPGAAEYGAQTPPLAYSQSSYNPYFVPFFPIAFSFNFYLFLYQLFLPSSKFFRVNLSLSRISHRLMPLILEDSIWTDLGLLEE